MTISLPKRSISSVILTLIAGAISVSAAMLWLRAWQDATARIATAQSQIDRIQWIVDHRDELEARYRDATANQDLTAGFIHGDSADQATAMLHRIVKRAVDASQSAVLSAQPLPARQDGAITIVTVRYQISVPPDGLTRFLYDIETGRPYTFIDSIDITSSNGIPTTGQASARLSVQVDIHAYFKEAPHG